MVVYLSRHPTGLLCTSVLLVVPADHQQPLMFAVMINLVFATVYSELDPFWLYSTNMVNLLSNWNIVLCALALFVMNVEHCNGNVQRLLSFTLTGLNVFIFAFAICSPSPQIREIITRTRTVSMSVRSESSFFRRATELSPFSTRRRLQNQIQEPRVCVDNGGGSGRDPGQDSRDKKTSLGEGGTEVRNPSRDVDGDSSANDELADKVIQDGGLNRCQTTSSTLSDVRLPTITDTDGPGPDLGVDDGGGRHGRQG